MKPLAVTPGEPAGIGPDIIVTWAQAARDCDVVVFADPDMLLERARALGQTLRVDTNTKNPARNAGVLSVAAVPAAASAVPGQLDPVNASYVIETLARATDACLAGQCAGLITGPVQKSIINDAGMAFSGHTEFLAARCGAEQVVMMLVASTLRVALATTHVALRDVPALITRERLRAVLEVLLADLDRRFAIAAPRVLVAGLNPHAGERGHLGREEIEVIGPVCDEFAARGVIGPLPADTLFTPRWLEGADAVLAMFHDQGLPVLKYAGFGEAVNVTLGLPIVRTSVDHGTALDIAGSGRADGGSFAAAIALALAMSA